jgi:hypothetical protein
LDMAWYQAAKFIETPATAPVTQLSVGSMGYIEALTFWLLDRHLPTFVEKDCQPVESIKRSNSIMRHLLTLIFLIVCLWMCVHRSCPTSVLLPLYKDHVLPQSSYPFTQIMSYLSPATPLHRSCPTSVCVDHCARCSPPYRSLWYVCFTKADVCAPQIARSQTSCNIATVLGSGVGKDVTLTLQNKFTIMQALTRSSEDGWISYISLGGLTCLSIGGILYILSRVEDSRAVQIRDIVCYEHLGGGFFPCLLFKAQGEDLHVLFLFVDVLKLRGLLPLLVAIRGRVYSTHAKKCELSDKHAVVHEVRPVTIMQVSFNVYSRLSWCILRVPS